MFFCPQCNQSKLPIQKGFQRMPNGPLQYVLILLAISVTTLLFSSVIQYLFKPRVYYKRHAKRAYRRIRRASTNEAALLIMNQLSPYSFEELVVLAFRRADNISKAKSSGYSRDGGFDGYARTKGGDWLGIQSKKYKGYINRGHVLQHSKLCRRSNRKPVFVYTGKASTDTLLEARRLKVTMVDSLSVIELIKSKSTHSLNHLS